MNRPMLVGSIAGELIERRTFRVGRATVDPVSRDATWPGGKVRLQPQTYKVLAVLAARRGDVVTRDELVQLCWDGRIVGEDVINRSISLLRHFAERARGFTIETIPRTGYRLVEDGVAGPVASRRVVLAGGVGAAAAIVAGAWLISRPEAAPPPSNRIAVLPFENLTGDPAEAYFSDGIAEELRAALSRVGMQVIGRTSSDAVRDMDAKAAAARLGVPNILIGSVRRSPGTIRIDAQLLRGSDGVERWSQSYDRSPGDVIKIQSDIAENVASALSVALGSGARAVLTAGGTRNPEAQRLLLQALAAARAETQAGYQRAIQLLGAAVAVDPRYGDAYARRSYLLEYYVESYVDSPAEVNSYRSEALRSARIAVRLAPNFGRAHWALANYLQGVLEIAPADVEFRKAAELAPGDAGSLSDYALWVLRIGSADRALALANRALALDPLEPDAYRRRFMVLYYRHEFETAVAFSRQVERDTPELFTWPADLGLALIGLNRLEEAQSCLERAPPDFYLRLVGECVILLRQGRRREFDAKFARLRGLFGDLDNYQYAQVYAQLGDRARTFAALRRAWTVRVTGLLWIRVDPLLDPVRNDARFPAMLRTMKLPA
jgi:serine/threonine-protein kinase